jgi:hypothetical protein
MHHSGPLGRLYVEDFVRNWNVSVSFIFFFVLKFQKVSEFIVEMSLCLPVCP